MSGHNVRRKAAERHLPSFVQWLANSGVAISTDTAAANEAIMGDIVPALARANDDGYRMAKQLDLIGWKANTNLVTLCEELLATAREETNKDCIEWIKQHGLSAPPKGSFVMHRYQTADGYGRIVDTTADGRALVAFHKLGHIPTWSSKPGCRGVYCNWEDLRLIDQPFNLEALRKAVEILGAECFGALRMCNALGGSQMPEWEILHNHSWHDIVAAAQIAGMPFESMNCAVTGTPLLDSATIQYAMGNITDMERSRIFNHHVKCGDGVWPPRTEVPSGP